jgi:hypothetical protein
MLLQAEKIRAEGVLKREELGLEAELKREEMKIRNTNTNIEEAQT